MEEKFAIIEAGKISKIIIANPSWIATSGLNAVAYTTGNVGDAYDNGVITPAPPPEQVVINYRTARKDRLCVAMYHDNNAYVEVKAAVERVNGEIAIWWDTASSFNLDDPRLQAALQVLNISEERAQQWFNAANQIP